MKTSLLVVLLCASMASAGAFDDTSAKQTTPDAPPPANSPDGIAQAKYHAAAAKAEAAYHAAMADAEKQLIAELNAAMDQAMTKRSVADVKRIDEELSKAKLDAEGDGATGSAVVDSSRPKSVVFLFRASGSMINSIASVKARINKELKSLDPSQRYNICYFRDTSTMAEFGEMRQATTENLASSEKWLGDQVTAGTTNTVAGIGYAFHWKPEAIYYFTGTDPVGIPGTLPVAIRKFNPSHSVRFFPVMFANSEQEEKANKSSVDLLKLIASDNGGKYECVYIDGQ